ncbi:MAG: Uma2 family endonuclease [Chloroflexota bacterium]
MSVNLKEKLTDSTYTQVEHPPLNITAVTDFDIDSTQYTNGNGYEDDFWRVHRPPADAVMDGDEAIYGWRYIVETDEHGKKQIVGVPLTLDDYLHPQEGDDHMNNRSQRAIIKYIESVLELYLRHIQGLLILTEVGIDWNIPGIQHYSPDISVLFNVQNPERSPQTIFKASEEGTVPSLLIEVTSPSSRHADLQDKVQRYEQLGVPYYFIVDGLRRRGNPIPTLRLLGYELTSRGYVEITPNQFGWLWMAPVNAWIGLHEGDVRCYDAQGNPLPTPDNLADDLIEASDRLAETSQNLAEESVARAEAERRAEEEARRAEEEARRAEEEARRAEEEARRAEEEAHRAEEEAAARIEAERRAKEETQMRRQLEEQIRALQAQLNIRNL